MRLKLVLGRREEAFVVPLHYNHMLQSLIYRHIDAELGRALHEQGVATEHGRFRFFTFSRLLGRFERQETYLLYRGEATLYIASPSATLMESLALRLSVQGELPLGAQRVRLRRIELLPPPELGDTLTVRALAPITLRAKQRMPQPAIRYLTPFEPRFSERIINNLRAKLRAWHGQEFESGDASCTPLQVDLQRDQRIVNFKGTWIVGWTGVYQIRAPREYLQMALATGIGERNSAGFGFLLEC